MSSSQENRGERFARLRNLVEDALELAPGDRRAYLETRCGDDAQLLADALALAESSTAGPLLDSPVEDMGSLPVSLVGKRIGEFELLGEIGRGGMGVVYRAHQTSLGRDVAIKLIANPAMLASDQARERFRREARSAAQVDHPAIARVLTHGEEGAIPFLAMELVEGDTLAHRLLADGPPITKDAIRSRCRWILDLARALGAAHASRVVHRDVKPANVLLTPEGTPKLVDFGIARDERFGSMSATGDMIGTPHYMSPEQLRGHAKSVDERTDIYSLGVVLFECLTGERPYRGENPLEMLEAIKSEPARRLRTLNPKVPADLQWIVERATELEPAHRYGSVRDFADDLKAFLDGRSPVHAGPRSKKRRVVGWAQRNRAVLTASVIAALAAAIVFMTMRGTPEPSALVNFTTVPSGLPVEATRIDTVTSIPLGAEPIKLGKTPLNAVALPVGTWRLEVLANDRRHWGERVDSVESSSTLSLPTFFLRPESGGTVPIPAGKARLLRSEREVPAFRIDAFEVTNLEYLEFVRDTGHRAPEIWPQDWMTEGLSELWHDLPVVTVSYFDARTFAAWSGKRLPSEAEWVRAATGDGGWPFPWGTEFADEHEDPDIANVRWPGRKISDFQDHRLTGEYNLEGARTSFLTQAQPVTQSTRYRSPFGVARAMGNVQEWTSSPTVDQEGPQMGSVQVMGSGWRADVYPLQRKFQFPRTGSTVEIGFRCAR